MGVYETMFLVHMVADETPKLSKQGTRADGGRKPREQSPTDNSAAATARHTSLALVITASPEWNLHRQTVATSFHPVGRI